MYQLLAGLDVSTMSPSRRQYSRLNAGLQCGSTTYYIVASTWALLSIIAVSWLIYSNKLYSSFADPVLVNSRTGFSALLSTYSCSLVIGMRILIEVQENSILTPSKDICSGVAVAVLLISAIYQARHVSYLDSKMARFVQRNTILLFSLAFLITQTLETRFKVIGNKYISMICSLVLFSLAERISSNINKH